MRGPTKPALPAGMNRAWQGLSYMRMSKCQVYERSLAWVHGIRRGPLRLIAGGPGWHAEPRVRVRIVTGKYSSFAEGSAE